MFAPTLTPDLHKAVLDRLGSSPEHPNLQFLQHLVGAYVRTVPWESAFRIVKRAAFDGPGRTGREVPPTGRSAWR